MQSLLESIYNASLPTINQIKSIFFKPSELEGPNYRFSHYEDPKPIPPSNERNQISNQKVVIHALRHELFGWDAEHIINSFFLPDDVESLVYETMQKGNLPPHSVPRDIHYQRGRQRSFEMFAPPFLVRPVHFADLRFYPWNWKPSAERPYTTDPKYHKYLVTLYNAGEINNTRKNFGNMKDIIFVKTREEIHYIKRQPVSPGTPLLYNYPMTAHAKPVLSERGKDPKVRLIYGVPKLHVLGKAMFYWPIINYHKYCKREDTPLLWPYVTILGGWHRLNHDLLTLYFNTYFTVDWSGFDFTALFDVIRDINNDDRAMFDFDNGYIPTHAYPVSPANPQHFQNLWDWLCEQDLAMKFVMPDGSTWIRLHRGIPSGLFTTQWLDSRYNMVMLLTILDRMGFDISTIFIKVQGDDSISAVRIFIPANQHHTATGTSYSPSCSTPNHVNQRTLHLWPAPSASPTPTWTHILKLDVYV
jgi:hypothetical protein